MKNARFQVFNWLSALLWVCSVTGVGLAISYIPFVKRHEDQVMTCLMILPIVLLVSGLVGTIVVVVRKNAKRPLNKFRQLSCKASLQLPYRTAYLLETFVTQQLRF